MWASFLFMFFAYTFTVYIPESELCLQPVWVRGLACSFGGHAFAWTFDYALQCNSIALIAYHGEQHGMVPTNIARFKD